MLTTQLKVDMINAWSMLYDEMNDLDWVSANGGFEYTPTLYDVKADGHSVNIDDATEHDWDDFWSSMKDDTIELNIGNSQPWKYNEEEIVKELIECQGNAVDIGGYYKPDPTKVDSFHQKINIP